jgi:transposase
MVLEALAKGIKPTARMFHAQVKTVRKWVNRYRERGVAGLKELSRAPKHIPHKTPPEADVETVHHRIELEFFDIERFRDRRDFFRKASTYQRWFNILRKNGHTWDKSPLDILREAAPHVGEAVVTLPALDLDELVRRKIRHLLQSSLSPSGGYDVPGQTPSG